MVAAIRSPTIGSCHDEKRIRTSVSLPSRSMEATYSRGIVVDRDVARGRDGVPGEEGPLLFEEE